MEIGEAWEFLVPSGYNPSDDNIIVTNKEPVYSDQVLFDILNYDAQTLSLSILEGVTNDEHIGKYSINLSLQDDLETESETYILILELFSETYIAKEESNSDFSADNAIDDSVEEQVEELNSDGELFDFEAYLIEREEKRKKAEIESLVSFEPP